MYNPSQRCITKLTSIRVKEMQMRGNVDIKKDIVCIHFDTLNYIPPSQVLQLRSYWKFFK